MLFKKKLFIFICFDILAFIIIFSCEKKQETEDEEVTLRSLYEQPIEKWPAAIVDSSIQVVELGLLPKPQTRQNKDIAYLGRVLFFDPRLSSSNSIACASCHDPDNNWTDLKEKSFGHERRNTTRNSMTLENIWAQPGPFFWDGRAATLEDQSILPIESHLEMNEDLESLPSELNEIKGYSPLFTKAFNSDSITLAKIQTAIASFERTITSKQTDFDKFLKGNYTALTDQQIEGLHIFRTKAKCMNCHNGPFFSDFDFHNEGQHHLGKKGLEDLGLYDATGDVADIGKFKTPSLRNVMNTKPWMHNGLFDEMKGILLLYNQGMLRPEATVGKDLELPIPPKDPLLHKLQLTRDEIDALEAFLHSLSSLPNKVRPPKLPE